MEDGEERERRQEVKQRFRYGQWAPLGVATRGKPLGTQKKKGGKMQWLPAVGRQKWTVKT